MWNIKKTLVTLISFNTVFGKIEILKNMPSYMYVTCISGMCVTSSGHAQTFQDACM